MYSIADTRLSQEASLLIHNFFPTWLLDTVKQHKKVQIQLRRNNIFETIWVIPLQRSAYSVCKLITALYIFACSTKQYTFTLFPFVNK